VTIIQRNAGTFNGTSFSVAPSAGSFGTGTVLVVAVFGNTTVTTPGGATQRTTSVVDMGLYSYDLAGSGQSSVGFTNAAGTGEWFVWELSSGSTWLTGSAAQVNTALGTYTTPSITPTLGNRHLLAVAGGNGAGSARDVSSWTNSFTEFADNQVLTQDWTFSAGADVDVAADGLTSYSTTATFSAGVATRGGMTLAYNNASASSAPVGQQLVVGQAVNRSYTY
jgi:hypothetical protein